MTTIELYEQDGRLCALERDDTGPVRLSILAERENDTDEPTED